MPSRSAIIDAPPLGAGLRVVARVVRTESRIFEGTGELLLPTGEVAATAAGKHLKLAVEKPGDFDAEGQEWRVTRLPSDPKEIDSGAKEIDSGAADS